MINSGDESVAVKNCVWYVEKAVADLCERGRAYSWDSAPRNSGAIFGPWGGKISVEASAAWTEPQTSTINPYLLHVFNRAYKREALALNFHTKFQFLVSEKPTNKSLEKQFTELLK